MDKKSRALYVAEDNSAAIEGLRKELRARTSAVALTGATVGGVTSFGNVTAYDGCGVTVAFDGSAASLIFCGSTVATGGSPLFAVLPPSRGELKLSATRSNARALLTCAKK